MSLTETMNTPTPDQIREALEWAAATARDKARDARGNYAPALERWFYGLAEALESALAQPASAASPPPVEDAAVEEALDVTPQYARATLRAALADLLRLRQRPKLSTLKRYKKYLEDELLRKGRSSHTPADCCKRAAEAITDTYALDDSHPYREVVREIRDWLRDGGEQ